MVKPRIRYVNGAWQVPCRGLITRSPFIVGYRGSAAEAFRHFRERLFWTSAGPLLYEGTCKPPIFGL